MCNIPVCGCKQSVKVAKHKVHSKGSESLQQKTLVVCSSAITSMTSLCQHVFLSTVRAKSLVWTDTIITQDLIRFTAALMKPRELKLSYGEVCYISDA